MIVYPNGVAYAGADHFSPARRWFGNPQAKKTQSCFGKDRQRNRKGKRNNKWCNRVREDMRHDDAEISCAERPRGGYKFLFAEDQELRTCQARRVYPCRDRQHKNHVGDSTAYNTEEEQCK